MTPQLPTDDDTNILFDHAVERLRVNFEYSAERAEALAREFYLSFRDPEYCQRAGVAVHDDDMFHHMGPGELARQIHYVMGMRADPAWSKYLKWRQEHLAKQKQDKLKRREEEE
jgi:hypothetical protein